MRNKRVVDAPEISLRIIADARAEDQKLVLLLSRLLAKRVGHKLMLTR